MSCKVCDGGGWLWYGLGTSCESDIIVAADSYVPCHECNLDIQKQTPDQSKIDAARMIGRVRSSWSHESLFDGTNLVDAWDANIINPRKYRFRQ